MHQRGAGCGKVVVDEHLSEARGGLINEGFGREGKNFELDPLFDSEKVEVLEKRGVLEFISDEESCLQSSILDVTKAWITVPGAEKGTDGMRQGWFFR